MRHPELRGRLYAVPNGDLRQKSVANRLMQEGVVPGVPDLEFIAGHGKTVYIEMKKDKGGVVSAAQRRQIDMRLEMGFNVFLIKGDYKAFFSAIDISMWIADKKHLDPSVKTLNEAGLTLNEWACQQGMLMYLFELSDGLTKVNFLNIKLIQQLIDWQMDTSLGFTLQLEGDTLSKRLKRENILK